MATVYRCDRDKQIGEDAEFLTDVVVPGSPAKVARDGKTTIPESMTEKIQLCPDCLAELRAFMLKA